jgi:hypothetical protein
MYFLKDQKIKQEGILLWNEFNLSNLMQTIKVAFIYEKNNIFLSGNHFDNTLYHFFMRSLKRNRLIDVIYFPFEKSFDVNKLKKGFDVILMVGNLDGWVGIDKLEIPIIQRIGDPHSRTIKQYEEEHEKYHIDYYFGFMPASYFFKYYPRNYKYKTIIHGLESSLYRKVVPFDKRIKNKILNTGATGSKSIKYKLKYTFQNRKSNPLNHYRLRILCNKLSYVHYHDPSIGEYNGDNYPCLLQKYASAIAATTSYPTIKYWEIPAAGCLTFMEITKKNNGDYLGFVDKESAIFINEKNYKTLFEEYLSDVENPKWKEIADNGRQYVLNELNNDKAVESLIELIKELT